VRYLRGIELNKRPPAAVWQHPAQGFVLTRAGARITSCAGWLLHL